MLNEEQFEKWLNEKNQSYRTKDIPPKQRPFFALADDLIPKAGQIIS